MKTLLALIFLSGPSGVVEYSCHGQLVYWYAKDKLGAHMGGSVESLDTSKLKSDFLEKVRYRHLMIIPVKHCANHHHGVG